MLNHLFNRESIFKRNKNVKITLSTEPIKAKGKSIRQSHWGNKPSFFPGHISSGEKINISFPAKYSASLSGNSGYLQKIGLAALAVFMFTMSIGCEPLNEGQDPVNGANGEMDKQAVQEFTEEELFSGEMKEFPADYEGDIVYLNFFSAG